MSDPAFALLREDLSAIGENTLWLVDENLSDDCLSSIRPRENLWAVSNRCDIQQLLSERGFQAQVSDFSLDSFAGQNIQRIVYRVSKEKALVHYLINAAAELLSEGGVLVLSGMKNDGIKTYIKKAQQRFGGNCDTYRGARQSQCGRIEKSALSSERLDDKDYERLRSIDVEPAWCFCSKPGLFGWDKVDRGSELLIEYLPGLLRELECAPQRVADIGCGYGFLSLKAARLLDAHFVATDNNAAAVTACRENFKMQGLEGEVILDNCAQSLQSSSFDLVLCNPPFHQGFELEGELTRRFLTAAWRLCRRGGSALFVVNAFVPLERANSGLFPHMQTLVNNKRFKVVSFRK